MFYANNGHSLLPNGLGEIDILFLSFTHTQS